MILRKRGQTRIRTREQKVPAAIFTVRPNAPRVDDELSEYVHAVRSGRKPGTGRNGTPRCRFGKGRLTKLRVTLCPPPVRSTRGTPQSFQDQDRTPDAPRRSCIIVFRVGFRTRLRNPSNLSIRRVLRRTEGIRDMCARLPSYLVTPLSSNVIVGDPRPVISDGEVYRMLWSIQRSSYRRFCMRSFV